MKSFKQYIHESVPPLHEDAILLTLEGFIETLQLLDAQKKDDETIVEVRENYPEPGTYAVRLLVGYQEEDTDSGV